MPSKRGIRSLDNVTTTFICAAPDPGCASAQEETALSNHELVASSPPVSQIDAVRHTMHTPPNLVRQGPTRLEKQQALRREACAMAVAHDRERIAEGLYDSVIHRLFGAGLQLQATCQVVDGPTQARLETTIDLLDSTIAELRKAIFSLH